MIKSPSINHSSCHQHPNNTLEKAVVYLCKFVIVLTEIDVIGFRCYNALLKTVESKTVMYSPATAYAYTSVKAYTAVLKDIAAAEVHAATLCILLQPFDVVLEQCLNCSLIQSGALHQCIVLVSSGVLPIMMQFLCRFTISRHSDDCCACLCLQCACLRGRLSLDTKRSSVWR